MALLDRVLQRGSTPPEPEWNPIDASRMTVVEHLEQLRRALIVSLIAWGAASIVVGLFWAPIVRWLILRGGLTGAYYTTPVGAFFLAVRVAVTLGFVVAFPVLAQQAWWFVSPGLHRHERRLVLPLGLATVVFFALGVAFALTSLPLFIHILTAAFVPSDLHYLPVIDDYIGFILLLVVAYGLVFELPIVIYVLGRVGIVSSARLYRHRAAWVIGLGVLANFMTPGADPVTPLIMFIPLWAFWEASTLLLKLTGR